MKLAGIGVEKPERPSKIPTAAEAILHITAAYLKGRLQSDSS